MNVNEIKTEELTIAQAKVLREKAAELDVLFGATQALTSEPVCEVNDIYKSAIGKYVIVRSRNEGLNAGYLEQADSSGCVLTNVKRLYKPISKDRTLSWYEGVSVSGLGDKSIVSGAAEKKIITEDYSITICTQVAKDSIEGFKSNETTY